MSESDNSCDYDKFDKEMAEWHEEMDAMLEFEEYIEDMDAQSTEAEEEDTEAIVLKKYEISTVKLFTFVCFRDQCLAERVCKKWQTEIKKKAPINILDTADLYEKLKEMSDIEAEQLFKKRLKDNCKSITLNHCISRISNRWESNAEQFEDWIKNTNIDNLHDEEYIDDEAEGLWKDFKTECRIAWVETKWYYDEILSLDNRIIEEIFGSKCKQRTLWLLTQFYGTRKLFKFMIGILYILLAYKDQLAEIKLEMYDLLNFIQYFTFSSRKTLFVNCTRICILNTQRIKAWTFNCLTAFNEFAETYHTLFKNARLKFCPNLALLHMDSFHVNIVKLMALMNWRPQHLFVFIKNIAELKHLTQAARCYTGHKNVIKEKLSIKHRQMIYKHLEKKCTLYHFAHSCQIYLPNYNFIIGNSINTDKAEQWIDENDKILQQLNMQHLSIKADCFQFIWQNLLLQFFQQTVAAPGMQDTVSKIDKCLMQQKRIKLTVRRIPQRELNRKKSRYQKRR